MVLNTRVITCKAKNKAKVTSSGQMAVVMLVTSLTTTSTVRDSTSGLMAETTMETGNSTKCMGMVSLHGMMEEDTKENTTMTKSKAKACFIGQTVEDIMVVGKMENNMELVNTSHLRERLDSENGKRAKEPNGWKRMNDDLDMLHRMILHLQNTQFTSLNH